MTLHLNVSQYRAETWENEHSRKPRCLITEKNAEMKTWIDSVTGTLLQHAFDSLKQLFEICQVC